MPISTAERETWSPPCQEIIPAPLTFMGAPRGADPQPVEISQAAAAALRRGDPVALIDGVGDGYLVAGAATITAETVNLFTKLGRGIVMLAITPAKALVLGLQLQPRHNVSERTPLCTVSIEAAQGATTGISAADRALTLRTAASAACERAMLVSPGHIFPVVARSDGQRGDIDFATAALSLLRRTTGQDAAACVQVLDEGGDLLRGDALLRFAQGHGVPAVDGRTVAASRPCLS